jgi:hypothetical protein
MKTFTMVLLAASRTAAAAFAPRAGLAFAPSAATRAYSRSATALAAGNPKGRPDPTLALTIFIAGSVTIF